MTESNKSDARHIRVTQHEEGWHVHLITGEHVSTYLEKPMYDDLRWLMSAPVVVEWEPKAE